jgi:general secretion pathway protein A
MYKNYYRFSEEPFALNHDPKFLFLARSHFQALSAMMSGIQEKKGIIIISGEAGVGKTTLIYALLKDLNEKLRTAFIFNPRLDSKELLEIILRDLEVPIREGEKKLPSLLLQFRNYLNERLLREETVAVVIDEAQSLEEEVLEVLLKLSNPDIPAAKLLQTILVGHPELEMKLDAEKLRPFKNRITVRRQVCPLTRDEGRGYIKYRLKVVGRDISEIFTSEAINRIWEFAGGMPRVMNLLCDRALLIGYSKSSPIIDSKIVKEVIQDFTHLRPRKSEILRSLPSQKKPSYSVIKILFLIFSVGVFVLSLSKILTLIFRK